MKFKVKRTKKELQEFLKCLNNDKKNEFSIEPTDGDTLEVEICTKVAEEEEELSLNSWKEETFSDKLQLEDDLVEQSGDYEVVEYIVTKDGSINKTLIVEENGKQDLVEPTDRYCRDFNYNNHHCDDESCQLIHKCCWCKSESHGFKECTIDKSKVLVCLKYNWSKDHSKTKNCCEYAHVCLWCLEMHTVYDCLDCSLGMFSSLYSFKACNAYNCFGKCSHEDTCSFMHRCDYPVLISNNVVKPCGGLHACIQHPGGSFVFCADYNSNDSRHCAKDFCPYLHLCSYCKSPQHSKSQCHSRHKLEVCLSFNRGHCRYDAYHCKRMHCCSICRSTTHTSKLHHHQNHHDY